MLIGRADDPPNPCSLAAIKAAHPLGRGSRNPSGPAAAMPRQTGRTHDRSRTGSDFLRQAPCNERAVHTRATVLRDCPMVDGLVASALQATSQVAAPRTGLCRRSPDNIIGSHSVYTASMGNVPPKCASSTMARHILLKKNGLKGRHSRTAIPAGWSARSRLQKTRRNSS
jgi:hypothetical protein